jgi:hypothetical protein
MILQAHHQEWKSGRTIRKSQCTFMAAGDAATEGLHAWMDIVVRRYPLPAGGRWQWVICDQNAKQFDLETRR